jgi:hypothetical protein
MSLEKTLESDKNLFEEFGLEVKQGEVEVGGTYPIFGMITKILDDTPGNVIVELNFGIVAKMTVGDSAKVEVLKERCFETGIFVSTITRKEPSIEAECRLVVFGKRQSFNA